MKHFTLTIIAVFLSFFSAYAAAPIVGGNDWAGEPWSERFFEELTVTFKKAVVIETDGAKMTTVGIKYMGSNLDVTCGTYGEGELDWNKGTKLVLTAKDNISQIVFKAAQGGNFKAARADKGTMKDGVWTGKLLKGEVLTLTANEGMFIRSIDICYNGADYVDPDPIEEEGWIDITWPLEGDNIEKVTDGSVLCKFTTTRRYSQVTVELRNTNLTYHNLYDLPMRCMDKVPAGDVTCTTATPGTQSPGRNPAWYAYNGDVYTLTVRGYVEYWDVPDRCDAMATITLYGKSDHEHTTLSKLNLINITPVCATDKNPDTEKDVLVTGKDNVVTLEFDGQVKEVIAVRPGNMSTGVVALDLKTEAVAGSDGKKWEITIPESELEKGIDYNFEIKAKDKDNNLLDLNSSRSDHALALIFGVDDHPSGIQNITMDANNVNRAVYTITGQRTTPNHKGIIIVGNRKYCVK